MVEEAPRSAYALLSARAAAGSAPSNLVDGVACEAAQSRDHEELLERRARFASSASGDSFSSFLSDGSGDSPAPRAASAFGASFMMRWAGSVPAWARRPSPPATPRSSASPRSAPRSRSAAVLARPRQLRRAVVEPVLLASIGTAVAASAIVRAGVGEHRRDVDVVQPAELDFIADVLLLSLPPPDAPTSQSPKISKMSSSTSDCPGVAAAIRGDAPTLLPLRLRQRLGGAAERRSLASSRGWRGEGGARAVAGGERLERVVESNAAAAALRRSAAAAARLPRGGCRRRRRGRDARARVGLDARRGGGGGHRHLDRLVDVVGKLAAELRADEAALLLGVGRVDRAVANLERLLDIVGTPRSNTDGWVFRWSSSSSALGGAATRPPRTARARPRRRRCAAAAGAGGWARTASPRRS